MWDCVIRIRNSWEIILVSLSYMKSHKQLFIFPILITGLIAPFIITIYMYAFHAQEFPFWRIIIVSLLGYFCGSVIVVFMQVAAVQATITIITKKSPEILKSFEHALNRLYIIGEWGLLFGLMHYNLSALTDSEHEQNGSAHNIAVKNATTVIQSVESITEFAWELTLFFVPVFIAVEKKPLAVILNHAMKFVKEQFGKTVTVQFSFYSFDCLVVIISLFVLLLSMILSNINITLLFIVFSVFLLSILSIAQVIFKTGVYLNALGISNEIAPEWLIRKNFDY